MENIRFSLVVSTFNRHTELDLLLQSLEKQAYKNFEVIIVDQNNNGQNNSFASYNLSILIKRIKRICASAARNYGAQFATGDYITFPDDDCWYNNSILQDAYDILKKGNIDVLTGSSIDPNAKNSDGKFLSTSKFVEEGEIPLSGIEYSMFIKRNAFNAVLGFDENISPGSSGIYQSGEATDILYKLYANRYKIFFSSEITIYHPLKQIYTFRNSLKMMNLKKEFRYSAGFGYVLKKHKQYKLFAWYIIRSSGKVLFALALFRFNLVLPSLFSLYGRLFGFIVSPNFSDK